MLTIALVVLFLWIASDVLLLWMWATGRLQRLLSRGATACDSLRWRLP
jgi:hypothetical protein